MPDEKAGDELLEELARKLRKKYQEVLEEPLPPEIEKLLKQLEAKGDNTR